MRNRQRVFFLIWGVLNKSKTLTSSLHSSLMLSCCRSLSKFLGSFLLLNRAACSRMAWTSFVFPTANNHLGDSGNIHLKFRIWNNISISIKIKCDQITCIIRIRINFSKMIEDTHGRIKNRVYDSFARNTHQKIMKRAPGSEMAIWRCRQSLKNHARPAMLI